MSQPGSRVDDTDSIRRLVGAVRHGWPAIVATAVVFGLIALGVSYLQTPRYEAVATMYVTSGGGDAGQNAYQGPQASQQRVQSYTRLVNTDAVVTEALRNAGLTISVDAARAAVTASASVDTVLLNIAVVDKSRSVAVKLAGGVATAMTSYVSRLETPSGGGQPLARLTLVTPAVASGTPVSPKPVRNVVLAVVVGLLVGALGVVARSRYSNKVRDVDDIAGVADVPVLGVIPRDDVLRRRGLISFHGGATPAAEAFRKMRTNLTFARVDDPPQVILVTSPTAVDGKTTTAMNLAAALVESGLRVVIVDGDLRRPQVNRRSGVVGEVGLTNWLRGDGELEDLVQPSQVENLWVLASGAHAPNPAELLASNRTRSVLEELSASFDLVIVDSPPVLPVTDAIVLSQLVDGVIVVARAATTQIRDLSDAYNQLTSARASMIGMVLTDATGSATRSAYYTTKSRRSIFRRSRDGSDISELLE